MSFEAIIGAYNEDTKNNGKSGAKNNFDLRKYFTQHIPDGVDEAVKQIRILPPTEGSKTPFVKVKVHSTKIEGKYKKLVCPKEEKGEPCAFCDMYDLINAHGTESEKKDSYKLKPMVSYVIKVIDRDEEDFGPKFWRINHSTKKKGNYDSIMGLFKLHKSDLTDIETGRDIILSIERNDDGFPTITNIVSGDVSKLTDDPIKADKWLGDAETWESVYGIKPYDYLEIVVKGGTPMYDKENKGFVDKNGAVKLSKDNVGKGENYSDELDQEITYGGEPKKESAIETKVSEVVTNKPEEPKKEVKKEVETEVSTSDDDDDDDDYQDLPF